MKPKDTIAAVKIYVVKEFDTIEDVLKKLPEPWEEYDHDTLRVASSGSRSFDDGWQIKCYAEVKDGQTKGSLEQELLDTLGGEWIVEDISRLIREREIIEQIREGVRKKNSEG